MRRLAPILLAAAVCAAGTPVDEGHRAFAEGRYADAVRSYEEAQARSGYSADLLFDLGNAYAREGDVGRAVLSYERARLLDARDDGFRAQLASVRRDAGLADEGARGWRDFPHALTRDEWTWVALAAVGLLLAGLLVKRRRARLWLAGLGLLLALPAAPALARHVAERDDGVVVAAAEVPLRIAPYGAAEAAGTLRPGQVVRLERAFDDFVTVEARNGARGWVPRAAVEPITP